MIAWDLVYSLSELNFPISFSESYHVTSNFTECRHYTNFKGQSHMVTSAHSPTCIVHADVTMTQSKVKVNVRVMTATPFRGLFIV